MNQIHKVFVNFLKDNNAFKQYVRNVRKFKKLHFQTWENHTNPFTIEPLTFCFDNRPQDLIDRSFSWAATLEGHNFWADLDMKWRTIYHTHKLRQLVKKNERNQ